jgi:1A family penicillin-binding protein
MTPPASSHHQHRKKTSQRVKQAFVGGRTSQKTTFSPSESEPTNSASFDFAKHNLDQAPQKIWAKMTSLTENLSEHIGTLFEISSARWSQSWQRTRKTESSPSETTSLKSSPQTEPQQTRPLWKKVLRFIFYPLINPYLRIATAVIAILALVGGTLGMVYILQDLPSPRNLTSSENFAVSTQIFDRNGILLYEIFADENRIPISIDELPPHVLQATIAIEDQRFYSHFGFDIIGITRALRNNLKGEPIQGGSTITQQLVKNALLTPERSVKRKLKEAVLAVLTEILYSKKQILEMYLNYISYGGTAVGIESASQYYFDKSARDLTVAEAALLAGLPQSPSAYSPFGSNTQAYKNRQAEVLNKMVGDSYITATQAEEAKAQPLTFALKRTDIKAPHFVFYVRDWLYKEYGVETVEKGGLRVTTTLDLNLQEVAQASVAAEISKLERYRVSNGAAMVVKPNTGEILAMVGSRDYFATEQDGQVNVTIAQRQPGSSIKPIMYSIAFQEKLLNPGTLLLDVPTCFEVPGQKPYCPKNYDGKFRGPVTVRKSVGNSLNIPAVKGLKIIGLEKFIEYATNLGITSWKDPSNYGLSLTLGGGEVRMIDMAQAFSVMANQGVKVPLTPVLKIEDYQGKSILAVNIKERLSDLIYLTQFDDQEYGELQRVMDRAPAYLTAHIMQDNNARVEAFGPKSELVIPDQIVSAKTGTTNDLKDNWTVGFTPEFLTITWVGNNDGTPMNQYVVSGVTGAAPIWNDIMSYILAGREPVWPEKPSDVASAGVCASGFPPTKDKPCDVRYTELYWMRGEPSKSQYVKKQAWIDVTTGQPAAEGQTENVQFLEHTFLEDPVSTYSCANCNQPQAPSDPAAPAPQAFPQTFIRNDSQNSGSDSDSTNAQ